MQFHIAAKIILEQNLNNPLTAEEIWKQILDKGYIAFDPKKTQLSTLSAVLGSCSINSTHNYKSKNLWFEFIPNTRPIKYKLTTEIFGNISTELIDENVDEDLDENSEENFESETVEVVSQEENDVLKLFWTKFLTEIVKHTDVYNGRFLPEKLVTWFTGKTGLGICHWECVVGKSFSKMELYVPNNKQFFDSLSGYKEQIEESFGSPLIWERLDNKKASRICIKVEGDKWDVYDVFNHPRILHYFTSNIGKFTAAISPYLEIAKEQKSQAVQVDSDELEDKFIGILETIFQNNGNSPLTLQEIHQKIGELGFSYEGITENKLTIFLNKNSQGSDFCKLPKPKFIIGNDNNLVKFKLRRWVSAYVLESLEEYGFIHISKLKEILEANGLTVEN